MSRPMKRARAPVASAVCFKPPRPRCRAITSRGTRTWMSDENAYPNASTQNAFQKSRGGRGIDRHVADRVAHLLAGDGARCAHRCS